MIDGSHIGFIKRFVCLSFLLLSSIFYAQDMGVSDIVVNEGTLNGTQYELCPTSSITLDITFRNYHASTDQISTVLFIVNGVNSVTTFEVAPTLATNIAGNGAINLTYPDDFDTGGAGLNANQINLPFLLDGNTTITVSTTSVSATGDTNTTNNATSTLVLVYDPDDPTMTVNPPSANVCQGEEIYFEIQPDDGTQYNFFKNGSLVQSSTTDYTITFSSNPADPDALSDGDVISYTMIDANGCTTDSSGQEITVTVNLLPAATLSSTAIDNVVCKGETVTFTASGGVTYTFAVEGIVKQSGPSAVYATSTIGNGETVSVTVMNASGCEETQSLTLYTGEITDAGSVVMSDANDIDGICYGDIMAGQISSTAVATSTINAATTIVYQWQSSLDATNWFNIDGAENADYKPTAALFQTTHFRRLAYAVVGDNTCAIGEESNRITVTVFPEFDATLSIADGDGDGIYCLDEVITVAAPAGATTYTFYIDGNAAQASTTNEFYPIISENSSATTLEVADGAVISVEITSAGSPSCTFTDDLTINAISSPINPSLTSNVPGGVICSNETIEITAAGGVSYTFTINGAGVAPGLLSDGGAKLTTNALTDDSVILVEVFNAAGCSESVSMTIQVVEVLNAGTISLTVADDEILCFGDLPTGDITSVTEATSSDTIYYQWQSKIAGGAFNDIAGQTSSGLTSPPCQVADPIKQQPIKGLPTPT